MTTVTTLFPYSGASFSFKRPLGRKIGQASALCAASCALNAFDEKRTLKTKMVQAKPCKEHEVEAYEWWAQVKLTLLSRAASLPYQRELEVTDESAICIPGKNFSALAENICPPENIN